MKRPPLTEAEVARRLPLWEALSDLYLDTEADYFVPKVIRAAREGEFSLNEVDDILHWEVRPALYSNYLSVAGEWAGWPPDWLKERILTLLANPSLVDSVLIGQNRFMPSEWPQIQASLTKAA